MDPLPSPPGEKRFLRYIIAFALLILLIAALALRETAFSGPGNSGASFWIGLVLASLLLALLGAVVAFHLSLFRQRAAERAAQQQVEEQEEIYEALFNAPNAVKLLLDPATGGIVDANEAACAFYGYPRPELCQRSILELNTLPGDVVRAELAAVERGEKGFFRFRHRAAGGEVKPVEVSCGPVRVRGRTLLFSIVRDASDRAKMEEALVRAERLSAVGTLASGIAHQYNNILTSVLGYLELALALGDLSPTAQRHIRRSFAAAQRAAQVTKDLLAFSRGRRHEFEPASLGEVVDRTLGFIRDELASSGTDLRIEHRPCPPVRLDAAWIGQAVLALVVNAHHAVSGAVEPTVEVTTGAEGSRAWIRVRDNGCGIPAENLSRIFSPFFSTKGEHATGDSPLATVRGVGLGLSVCETIVRDHGGRIEVESAPKRGSLFTLWLPLEAPAPPAVLPDDPDIDPEAEGAGPEHHADLPSAEPDA